MQRFEQRPAVGTERFVEYAHAIQFDRGSNTVNNARTSRAVPSPVDECHTYAAYYLAPAVDREFYPVLDPAYFGMPWVNTAIYYRDFDTAAGPIRKINSRIICCSCIHGLL